MKNNLTEHVRIYLHGSLGEAAGRKEWKLDVRSAAEALHAINCQTDDSIRRYFFKPKNAYGRFKVLVNGKEIQFSTKLSDLNEKHADLDLNELKIRRDDFKRLDVVPVLEGAATDWLSIVGMVMGAGIFSGSTNPYTAMIGVMLMTLGASNLLSQPPPMPEHRQIVNPSSDPTALANSYLFSGPINVINEGGPVPIGYGRLIVGSQVIMSAYDVAYIAVDDAGKVA